MSLVPPIRPWNPAPLQDRVVLVTGGAQGIGRGIAQAVIGAGGSVVIGDLDADAGRACIREWGTPARALFRRLDVASERSTAAFAAAALERFGRIDGLVNNAGLPDPHVPSLDALDLGEWNRRLSSLHGAFLCSRHALPALRQADGGGAIVNIASTRAHQSEPHSEAYAASKGGVAQFTTSLANEWASQGINVNGIAPGYMDTEMNVALKADETRSSQIMARIPAGRWGKPEDMVGAAIYLASDASDYVNGTIITVDGGWMGR